MTREYACFVCSMALLILTACNAVQSKPEPVEEELRSMSSVAVWDRPVLVDSVDGGETKTLVVAQVMETAGHAALIVESAERDPASDRLIISNEHGSKAIEVDDLGLRTKYDAKIQAIRLLGDHLQIMYVVKLPEASPVGGFYVLIDARSGSTIYVVPCL